LHAIRQLLDLQRNGLDESPPVSSPISDDPRVTGQRVFTRELSTYDKPVASTENHDEQDGQ
jgi:hypothetical protein